MFDLRVSSFDEVHGIVESGWPTRIISAISKKMPDYGSHHLCVSFDDIARPLCGYVHPLLEHVIKVLDFTKDLTDDDKVLVHCLAGISRSTSLAIGIYIQHGMSYEDAYNQVALHRPQLSPNALIIKYIDNHFELGNQLYELVRTNELYPHLVHRHTL